MAKHASLFRHTMSDGGLRQCFRCELRKASDRAAKTTSHPTRGISWPTRSQLTKKHAPSSRALALIATVRFFTVFALRRAAVAIWPLDQRLAALGTDGTNFLPTISSQVVQLAGLADPRRGCGTILLDSSLGLWIEVVKPHFCLVCFGNAVKANTLLHPSQWH